MVIGGDFNLTASSREYRSLLHAVPRLQDATEHHPLSSLKPTFRGWGPFQWAKARIDHCLHSREWICTDYRAVTPRTKGQPLSDHRALVVDLSSS